MSQKYTDQDSLLTVTKAWFPLDRNRIVKSCDSRFWFMVERLITIENRNRTEIGSDLQPKRFLS